MNSNLKTLMNGAFGRKVPAEFAAADYDYEAALRDEIRKLICDDNGHINRFKFDRNKIDLFELLAENLDEVLPQSLTSALDMFTEIRRVPQGSRPEFYVTRGKQRGKQFVTRATESGNYETFRLDRDRLDVWPFALGGAGRVDFERYLDGAENIADIYETINAGMVDRIFELIQQMLLSAWDKMLASNKVTGNSFSPVAMKKLCNVVQAYGSPVIYCTADFAAAMTNAIIYNATTKISDQDMIEVREQGYIGKFQGVPVVILPQSFTDETNTKLVMNPGIAYVIPTGKEKMIKLIFEGNSYFREWDDHEGDNSITVQAYTKVGLALVSPLNFWGMYVNTSISTGTNWDAYNTALQ